MKMFFNSYFRFIVCMICALCFVGVNVYGIASVTKRDLGNIDFSRLVKQVEFDVVPHKLKELRTHNNMLLSEQLNQIKQTLQVQPGIRITEQSLVSDIRELFISGYFSKVDVLWEPRGGNHMDVIFRLQLNPIVQNMLLKNNSVISEGILHSIIGTRKGQVLSVEGIQQDREAIEAWYKKHGYVLSKVLSIDLDKKNNLVFVFSDPKVNRVELNGLEAFSDYPFIISRELELHDQKVFNSLTLRKDRERLIQLGYFSDVSAPIFKETLDKERVNVQYDFKERKINLINVGLEQEEGQFVAFLRGDLNHALIPSDVLSGKTQVGYLNNQIELVSYTVRYHQPWLFNQAPISFSWDIWTEFKNQILTRDLHAGLNEVIRNRRVGSDVIFRFPLIKNRLSLSTKGLIEDVSPYDTSLTTGDDGYFTPYKLRSVSVGLSYSSLAKIYNPTKGTYWNLQYEKGGNVMGWNVGGLDFYRIRAEMAGFYQILPKTTLGLHVVGGLFAPFSSGGSDTIYTFEQEEFSIGGASSLRGYKDYFRVNEKLLLANIEFRKTLSSSFQTVIFWDIGTVFSTATSFEALPLYSGAGLGIRYFTPLGPIRFDLAYGDALMLQFGVGQMF